MSFVRMLQNAPTSRMSPVWPKDDAFHEYFIVLGCMPLPLTGKDKVLRILVTKWHQEARLCEANLHAAADVSRVQ